MENNTVDVQSLVWYYLPTVVVVPPLAVPANALVIYLLLGKPGICSTSEIFTLNLAVFDMMFCITVLVEYIYFLWNPTMNTGSFVAWGVNQGGGPLLLCLMALDSYVGVCHPLLFLRLKDPSLRLSLCLVVYVLTAATCGLIKLYSPNKWNVILVLISTSILIISTCNILILKSLRKSGPNKKLHPAKKRAFKLVLSSFVLVNVHYLPPISEYLLREFGSTFFSPFSPFTCATYTVLSVSSFVQPMSYLMRTKQLPKMRCHCCPAAETKTVEAV
ncbi:G-protein coupled receptor 15-like [Embiotoca jacksoni]|uniref:G-protein coupled receptor 15-like n=1 Tax=Embiotoca jacksoni TaxID=100190 RepID=UPI00370478A9